MQRVTSSVIKRIVDIIVAACGLVLLSPVFAVVALQVRREFGSPIFFTQMRPGLSGVSFQLIKFRSMRAPQPNSGSSLTDKDRLTDYGRKLRASSLDELPELINVLKGEMSIVGPRPLLVDYLPLYSAEQRRRHDVRPGITGWAQVNGRNAISWEDKFEYDVWYVDNHSIWLDIKIIFLTIFKVIKRDDISEQGHETMSRFEGAGESENR